MSRLPFRGRLKAVAVDYLRLSQLPVHQEGRIPVLPAMNPGSHKSPAPAHSRDQCGLRPRTGSPLLGSGSITQDQSMVAEFIHAGSFVGMPSPTPVSQPLHGTSGVASRRSRHPASRAGVMTTQAMGIKLQSGVRFHQQSSPKTAISQKSVPMKHPIIPSLGLAALAGLLLVSPVMAEVTMNWTSIGKFRKCCCPPR